jgi:iron(III) transport system substrate-binding protein
MPNLFTKITLKRLYLLIPLIVLCTGVSSCTNQSNQIILLSGQHEQTTAPLVNKFESLYHVNVSVRYSDDELLAKILAAEGNHTYGDLIYVENIESLNYLAKKGLLIILPATITNSQNVNYRSSKGFWVGVSLRVSVLMYNPSLISKKDLPVNALELANPRYHNLVGIAPTEPDFIPVVTAMQKAYGAQATINWLKGLKANAGSHIYQSDEDLAYAINFGQVALGIVNQYYYYRLKANYTAQAIHSKITYFAPEDPGYVLSVSGIAILKTSTKLPLDIKFIKFILSQSGQQSLVDSGSFEYPINPKVQNPLLKPLTQLQPYPLKPDEIGDGSNAFALLQDAGLI